MPKVGNDNEPLLSRSMYGYNNGVWQPITINSNGYLEVTLPITENISSLGKGYVNGAWHNNPISFGFSDTVEERITDNNLSAGSPSTSTTPVPSGEIHVITSISFYVLSASISQVLVNLVRDGVHYQQWAETGFTSGVWSQRNFNLILKATDAFYFFTIGTTAGDTIGLTIAGYKVDIDL